jgi:type I site-specific restriction endonuclease
MQRLNLPYFDLIMENRGDTTMVFDEIRKKWLVCTPEEWVRQNLMKYLIREKKVPPGLIALEKEINVHGLQRRYDAMVHNKFGKPLMLVECKAPSVKIIQAAFQQIAVYNTAFKVPYLFVSNGLKHYMCYVDHEKGELRFMEDLPAFAEWDVS